MNKTRIKHSTEKKTEALYHNHYLQAKTNKSKKSYYKRILQKHKHGVKVKAKEEIRKKHFILEIHQIGTLFTVAPERDQKAEIIF